VEHVRSFISCISGTKHQLKHRTFDLFSVILSIGVFFLDAQASKGSDA